MSTTAAMTGEVEKAGHVEETQSEEKKHSPPDKKSQTPIQGQPDETPPTNASGRSPTTTEADLIFTNVTLLAHNFVAIDDNSLFPDLIAFTTDQRRGMITDTAGFEEVRELSSSRFSIVRFLRRAKAEGGCEYCGARYYTMGDNTEGISGCHHCMRSCLDHCYPHVMSLIGVIDPTNTTDPMLLTPYSDFGSLDDVIELVHLHDPSPFWNDATKLRMMIQLMTGSKYLHNRGIVHRELKPKDIIVDPDGSLRICGLATSILEEHRFTKAAQVGVPSYMAPDIYDDGHGSQRLRDPAMDVFSLRLIAYEILCGQRVFPSRMSAAMIMRRTMSTRASDRPIIPDTLYPILPELITRIWIPSAMQRPSLETLWKRMCAVGFRFFKIVEVRFVPLNRERRSSQRFNVFPNVKIGICPAGSETDCLCQMEREEPAYIPSKLKMSLKHILNHCTASSLNSVIIQSDLPISPSEQTVVRQCRAIRKQSMCSIFKNEVKRNIATKSIRNQSTQRCSE
jgi:serine/threonine protein kinase